MQSKSMMLRTDQKKIVILEQNHVQRDYIRSVVAADSCLSFCFDRVSLCFDNLVQLDPDLIVVGSFPRKSILRFINAYRATNCNLPSLLMTQDSEVKKYLEVNGPNYIKMHDIKLNLNTFNNSINDAVNEPKTQNRNHNYPFIVGSSPNIVRIKEILPELNKSRESVLIEGETGVGKELIARAIHCLSENKDLFIKISAKDVSPATIWLDLIKVIENSIPKTNRKKVSPSSSEPTTTIFIDELGYLPMSIQSELLHVVDNRHDAPISFSPLVKNNFRFISSTSVSSDSLISEDSFRKDLFYRLNVINLTVDPLRKRKEDIPLLTDYFSYRYCKMLNRSFFELPNDIIDIFMDYQWPGNTRELESVVRRAVMNCDDRTFIKEMCLVKNETLSKSHQMLIEGVRASRSIADTKDYLKRIERESLKDICSTFMGKVEKKVIKKALEATNWNRKNAAAMLNISYKSMLNKIKEYDLA
jgi:DNA-binding NtrC family response regulator